MAAWRRRSTPTSSTPTISCRAAASSCRRRHSPTEDRPMSTDDLLTTLAQKAAPGAAALVVVDVQNDFCAPDGYFGKIGADIATIQRAIPPLQRLIEGARAAGLLIVFVQAIYDPAD